MAFNLINRMTSIPIIHATRPVQHILAVKVGDFNLMMDNKLRHSS